MLNRTDGSYQYGQKSALLASDFSVPQYGLISEYMKLVEAKGLLFDHWSRGTFLGHLHAKEQSENVTFIVPFTYLDELRAYYRRLALMGVSALFLYTGKLPSRKKYSFLSPNQEDYVQSGGGGFHHIPINKEGIRRRGKYWVNTVGISRPMPDIFVEWLITEALEDFKKGKVYIAPAELVGLSNNLNKTAIETSSVVFDGKVISPMVSGTEFLLNLEMPFIDEMDGSTFNKILHDNELRLDRFRRAIKLLHSGRFDNPHDIVDELKDAVAEMMLSDSSLKFRNSITKYGGIFGSFGVGLSAVDQATSAPLFGGVNGTMLAATVASGTAIFSELYAQKRARKEQFVANKYSLFWDMGVKAPCDLRRKREPLKAIKFDAKEDVLLTENYDCHWLCHQEAKYVFTKRK